MSEPEKADLENLVKSPGWRRLKAWADAEWNGQISKLVITAAQDRDDVAALNKLRQVVAAQKAVELVLGWPDEQLRIIGVHQAKDTRPVSLARGGF